MKNILISIASPIAPILGDQTLDTFLSEDLLSEDKIVYYTVSFIIALLLKTFDFTVSKLAKSDKKSSSFISKVLKAFKKRISKENS